MKKTGCCVGGCTPTSVGARTGADIVGAMLVAPEDLGIDMRERAEEGVAIARNSIKDPLRAAVGSDNDLCGALRRELFR